MTKHEAAVFTAFTGIMFLSGEDFGIFHEYAEKILGRSLDLAITKLLFNETLYTHELGMLSDELREKARPDFMSICREATDDSWIDSKDRLPEIGEDVLIYISSPQWNNTPKPKQVAHLMYDGSMWELSDGEFNFGLAEVPKWMPLPD